MGAWAWALAAGNRCVSVLLSAELAREFEGVAPAAFAEMAECAVAAGGVHRDRAQQVPQLLGTREIEAAASAARELCNLPEGAQRDRVGAFVESEDRH